MTIGRKLLFLRPNCKKMAVTKLKRKEAKNRSRMTKRVDNIKRLKMVVNIASPYKGVSGIVLEDQENQ